MSATSSVRSRSTQALRGCAFFAARITRTAVPPWRSSATATRPGAAILELTHSWDGGLYEHGTAFGHVAIGVPDAYAAPRQLEANGVKVIHPAGPMQVDPAEVIAFVKDPDGYRIDLVRAAAHATT